MGRHSKGARSKRFADTDAHILSALLVTLAPSSKSLGPTQNSVISSRRVHTMVKCSSGESKHRDYLLGRGRKSRSTRCTRRPLPAHDLSGPLELCSQLYLLGPPRTRCHPGMRLFRRKALCAHFRFVPSYFYTEPIHRTPFPDDGQWVADIFNGHAIGCNAVSWGLCYLPRLAYPSHGITGVSCGEVKYIRRNTRP